MLPDNPNGSPQGSTLLGNSLLWVAPLIALLIGWIGKSMGGLELPAALTLSIAIWTALWWIFETVPIPVASLIPLAFLPMFGILSPQTVGEKYGHPLVLLLLGGFLLSKAMERSGAHRRIALMMVNACPKGDKFLILGFMIATAFLSMWISNTATTLMMLPMALAVVNGSKNKKLTMPLLLGIAFAANVGGIGTPIGTPPNLVMMAAYKDLGFQELSFSDWMRFGLPVSIIMTLVLWAWLARGVSGTGSISLPPPGNWQNAELRTLSIFALTALAWITRSEPFGGWKTWLDLPQANDASVAFIAVIILFCLPNGEKKGERLLDWKTANQIPWGMLVLVGAGLCLGEGFKQSGLSESIASALSGVENLPALGVLVGICLLVTFLTEMTSNTATTNLLMPILGAAAVSANLDPKLFMIPAALSASCAFMLPVATIPNAIVFGTGKISVKRMATEGFVLNLIGAGVVTGVIYFLL
ncbi:SLC13 family permease [Opitutales bacterium]|nr:SLC13 family permease [Opitutales bacterium]